MERIGIVTLGENGAMISMDKLETTIKWVQAQK